MDVYPSIASFFQRHLEASSLAVDAIADTLGDAIELLAQAILADQKLFSIGLGADRASATALTSLLQHGILRERPSLPVVELATHQIQQDHRLTADPDVRNDEEDEHQAVRDAPTPRPEAAPGWSRAQPAS